METTQKQAEQIAARVSMPANEENPVGFVELIPILLTLLPTLLNVFKMCTPTAGVSVGAQPNVKEFVVAHWNEATGEYDNHLLQKVSKRARKASRKQKNKLSWPACEAVAKATLDQAREADEATVGACFEEVKDVPVDSEE